jgi:acetyl-CoA C-acetyltransferase
MAAVFQASGLLSDHLQVALCGGVESMSRVQIGLRQGLSDVIRRTSQARSFGERIDRLSEIKWADIRLHVPAVKNRATGKSMGEHCEEMAKQWKIARADQDRIALQSHQRAVKALASGSSTISWSRWTGVVKDGVPRADSSAEKLASLKPAFDRASGAGTITAGNASPLTDGAAAIWVANDAGLARMPAGRPRVKLLDFELAAVDIFHEGLLMAPAYAIPRLLARNNLTLGCDRPVGDPRGLRGPGAVQRRRRWRARTSCARRCVSMRASEDSPGSASTPTAAVWRSATRSGRPAPASSPRP